MRLLLESVLTLSFLLPRYFLLWRKRRELLGLKDHERGQPSICTDRPAGTPYKRRTHCVCNLVANRRPEPRLYEKKNRPGAENPNLISQRDEGPDINNEFKLVQTLLQSAPG
jgi:hypothetical protein